MTFADSYPSLAERQASFQTWATEVRDPSEKAAVKKKIEVPGATAEYAIAELTKGFALKYSLAYTTGNMSGVGSPWELLLSREACLEAFRDAARAHFGRELHPGVSDRQKEAQKAILALLQKEGGQLDLFPS